MAHTSLPGTRAKPILQSFRKFAAELRREMFDSYKPEKHYMRGAGRKRDIAKLANGVDTD